jgi:hypothetical protein
MAAEEDGLQEAPHAGGDSDDQVVDEVLEVADDFSELVVNAMSQMEETDPQPVPQASLVDELEQVDIASPESDKEVSGEATGPLSLEEEWAKLLEEEAGPAESEGMADKTNQR